MSQWFRMYSEVLNDPKVQRLSGDDFKGWVNLLCLASAGDGSIPPVEDVSFALRIELKKARGLCERLIAAGLIVSGETGMKPHNWDGRQFKSDVSTDRVKRFRERSKKPLRSDAETPAETAPDTDTEQSVPLSKDNGRSAENDAEKDRQFWANAKAYLKPYVKGDPGEIVGKWARDYGKPETAQAITAAQMERPVSPVPFIEGALRRRTSNGYAPGHSGVPL